MAGWRYLDRSSKGRARKSQNVSFVGGKKKSCTNPARGGKEKKKKKGISSSERERDGHIESRGFPAKEKRGRKRRIVGPTTRMWNWKWTSRLGGI